MTSRTLFRIFASTVLLVGAAVTLGAQAVGPRPPSRQELIAAGQPQREGTITIRGLHHPVEVLRDAAGVAHIYAQDTHDLFFAQGYVAAQDNLWSLELWRRSVEGLMAEAFGPEYVERDKFARLLSYRGNWSAEFARYHPELTVILKAFAEGINTAIYVATEEGRIPVEFQDAGIKPDPVWNEQLLLTRVPAWAASGSATAELARALTTKLASAGALPTGLSPDDVQAGILDGAKGLYDLAVTLPAPATAKPPAAGGPAQTVVAVAAPPTASVPSPAGAWLVAGSRSGTGGPLLATSMASAIKVPSLIHLVAPGWNVIGLAEAALPGVQTGHNEHVAWAPVPTELDQADIYVEETDPANPLRYRHADGWRTMETERHLINVRGKRFQPLLFDVQTTVHGPVVWRDPSGRRAYVVRTVAAEPGTAAGLGTLAVAQARDAAGFSKALAAYWGAPAVRMLYADTTGGHGELSAGLQPVRAGWDGALPAPGDGRHEWTGLQSVALAPADQGSSGAVPESSDVPGAMLFDAKSWDRSTVRPLGVAATGSSPPLLFGRAAVEAAATQRLRLHPEHEYEADEPGAAFARVQPELFTDKRPVTVAWGDYDTDGYVDLFVGYQGGLARLFRNDRGRFVDVSIAAGIAGPDVVRSAAWGDFDGDGHLDLYLGFGSTATAPNRLFRNDGKGHFTDVAAARGVNDWGESRQITFVDYNNDGRVDLFVGFREKANRLYRNDGERFTEVSVALGLGGAQSTVGGIWFDYNEDGRLDLFLANQNGRINSVYRNEGERFTEVAKSLGLDGAGRTSLIGSVGIAVGDFNGDGRLDLFYANYGPSWLLRNDAPGKFTDVAPEMGVVINKHLVAAGWGDYDNDGKPDLYTCGYLVRHPNVRDYLLHNRGDRFVDATPGYMFKHDSDHGVAWADYDQDGAIDLALCDHEDTGMVSVYRNQLPAEKGARSLQVLVLDARGHYTQAGAEVRLYAAGTRTVIGANWVDAGSGYSSQSALPVHFGLPNLGKVDVEVTAMSNQGRKITRVEGIDPANQRGKPLRVTIQP